MKSSLLEVNLQQDTLINFYLEELMIDLEGIEVIGERKTDGMSRLKPVENFAIYEAKKNELIILDDFAANKATNNARQIFAKVPGLNIWESDFAGLQLDIAARGLGPSRTANFNTRQNGYDMSADALGYPESYYMPAMLAVDRIEVVRGAASLQYGSQFGGMLNFRLKEAPDKPFELNLHQTAGSFGLLNSFGSIGGTLGKVDYYAYFQHRRGDGWREHSKFEASTAFGRLGYQVTDKLKLGFEYTYMYYEAQQPGGMTDNQFAEGDVLTSLRPRNWFAVSWNLLASTIDYEITDSTKLNIRTFGLISGRDALGNLQQIGVLDNPDQPRTLITDEFQNIGSEARLLHSYALKSKTSTAVLGYRIYKGITYRAQGAASANDLPEFELLNPDSPEEFDYRFPSANHAFFAENLISLTSKLSLTTGARVEYIQTDAEGTWNLNRYDFAGNLISSTSNADQNSTRRWVPLFGLGASYYLKNNLSIYSNFSRNFRSITFSDLRVVNPNFQLDSLITDENGYNFDLGVRGMVGEVLNMDLSFFLLRYDDRIGSYDLPGSTTLFKTNIGTSRHLGLEFFGELNILNLLKRSREETRLTAFANLSITDARYIESDITAIDGKRVEYVPNIMLRTGLNHQWKGWRSTVQFSYLGDQFSDATNSRFNPNALTGIIPSYYVFDLSTEYQFKHIKVEAGVNNIGDALYFTRRAESYPGPGIIPATPRSFYVSLGLRF